MARTLTKKQREFVNEYADTGNATEAAFKVYDTDDKEVASVIGYENLTKPQIVNELKKLGFDSNNAKRVIGEILNDTAAEPKDRIKAAENVFKVQGDYAAEKHVNLNIDAQSTERTQGLGNRILGLLRRGDRTSVRGDTSPLDTQA